MLYQVAIYFVKLMFLSIKTLLVMSAGGRPGPCRHHCIVRRCLSLHLHVTVDFVLPRDKAEALHVPVWVVYVSSPMLHKVLNGKIVGSKRLHAGRKPAFSGAVRALAIARQDVWWNEAGLQGPLDDSRRPRAVLVMPCARHHIERFGGILLDRQSEHVAQPGVGDLRPGPARGGFGFFAEPVDVLHLSEVAEFLLEGDAFLFFALHVLNKYVLDNLKTSPNYGEPNA